MESLSSSPLFSSFPHRFPTHNTPKLISSSNKASQVAFAHNRDRHGDSYESGSRWSVDKSMIVLRRRIHQMRMEESGHELPAHWVEWERQVYASYAEHVYDLVGLLQTVLLSTRPIVAMAIASALLLGVPTSLLMAVLWALKIC
ncbi:hypothetical protein HPP92_004880 [Vanilla planifolia]|uniref:Uncharacterized protein n=1 Tax=Vanilla planifolia TaxID=51239 RepID=A0A835VAG2_VANPL|nr:hypothetical protein HPP92_004880 [Vanilla planifolia]